MYPRAQEHKHKTGLDVKLAARSVVSGRDTSLVAASPRAQRLTQALAATSESFLVHRRVVV